MMNTWFVLLAVPIAAGGVLASMAMVRAHKIKMKRRGIAIADFVKEFEGGNYSLDAIKIAYEDLFKEILYAPKRFDLLESTLELSSEDIYELLRTRARAHGFINVLSPSFLNEFPVETVDDYVRFVDRLLLGSI